MPIVITNDDTTPPSASVHDLLWLRTAVRDAVGEDAPDFWTTSKLNDYINEAITRFIHEQRWSWLLTPVLNTTIPAGQTLVGLRRDVALNRQFNLLLTLSDGSSPWQPKKVTPAVGFKLRTQNVGSGNPSWFYLAKTASGTPSLTFIPTPSTDVIMEYQYFREPEQLVADTDTPDVPDSYISAIVHRAAGEAWLKELNGGQKAQERFNLYETILAQAIDDEKGAANDDILIWGGEQPQLGVFGPDAWSRSHMPPSFGP